MPHVEFDFESRLPPRRVIAALTDFSEHRPDHWPDLEPGLYEVYSAGDHSADVQEGSRLGPVTLWAKEHYEWSEDSVTWTATESSFCEPGSHMSVTTRPNGNGGSKLHVVWDRTPSNLTGRVITTLVSLTRGKGLARGLQRALDQEAVQSDRAG